MDGNNYYYDGSYQQPAPAQPGKGFGITAMVLGILAIVIALVSCCIPFGYMLTILLGLAAIIFGIIAVAKKRGKGMGIAGIICGVVGLITSIVMTIVIVLFSMGMLAMPAFMMEIMEEYGYDDYYYDYDYDYDDYYYDYDYDYEYDDDWY